MPNHPILATALVLLVAGCASQSERAAQMAAQDQMACERQHPADKAALRFCLENVARYRASLVQAGATIAAGH